jgi:ribosome recycling factor
VPPTDDVATTEQKISRALQALERDLARIRPGAASASLLDDVHVDVQGRRTRLIEIASVTIPDPRQIVIQPWDPASLRAIGTAISHSRIGLTPTVDGGTIRVFVPALTGDRRRELIDLVRKRLELARVDIRAIRHEAMAAIRDEGRSRSLSQDEVRRRSADLQRTTDRWIVEVDLRGAEKEASLGLTRHPRNE